MLGLKLNHISKKGPRAHIQGPWTNVVEIQIFVRLFFLNRNREYTVHELYTKNIIYQLEGIADKTFENYPHPMLQGIYWKTTTTRA